MMRQAGRLSKISYSIVFRPWAALNLSTKAVSSPPSCWPATRGAPFLTKMLKIFDTIIGRRYVTDVKYI